MSIDNVARGRERPIRAPRGAGQDSAPGRPGSGTTAGTAGRADDRWVRAAWSRLAEPGDAAAARLVQGFGHAQAFALLEREGLGLQDTLPVFPPRDQAAAEDARGKSSGRKQLTEDLERFRPRLAKLDVTADLANATRVGARVVVPGDPEWPTGLDDLPAPPHCLWVRGDLDLGSASARSVAIVGARAATGYGQRQATSLAHGVAARGVTVVSGAAYGIDAAAHRGALAVGGVTIAVLACGVERAYPSNHRELLDTIAKRGLVVSEVPPGSAPLRHRFLERNRLIATMTLGTLVVEAGLRSGSRNTARTAAAHLRVVMALPGPVTSPTSAGCHEMIRSEAASLVTDVDEVMELIGRLGEDAAPARRGPDRAGDDLDPDERRVHDALGLRPRAIEEIAVITGLANTEVGSILGRLSLRRRARRADGGWLRA